MICNHCGNDNPDTLRFCKFCGSALPAPRACAPAPVYDAAPKTFHLPPEYKPLSPWAYFGYQLLFAIPIVGFILLIVFSCGGCSNINLKNFARSYWCMYLLSLVLTILFMVIGLAAFDSLL